MRLARLFAPALLVLLIACTPKPPPQPPEKKCPPTCPAGQVCTDPNVGCVPVTITSGLMRREGANLLRDGQPYNPFPCVGCCMGPAGNPTAPPQGWPMCGQAFVDSVLTMATGPLKPNWFEFRPGPFGSNSEPEYPGIGGYVGDTVAGGVNPALLAKLDEQVIYVGQHGGTAMVVLVDCWYCRNPGTAHPWRGTAALQQCGAKLDPIQTGWIEAVVKAVGRHAHVIWLVGNECDINPLSDGTYEAQVRQVVRRVEAEQGFPVHMIGGQTKSDVAQQGPIDYVVLHTTAPIDEPIYNKPTLVLEYNPEPPMTPDHQLSWRCRAKAAGTVWGLWRHGMPYDQWAQTVKSFSDDSCDGVDTSDCPFNVAPTAALRCKPFGTHGTCNGRPCPLWDCTPMKAGGGPVWPEGDALRAACEQKSMGGVPSYSVSPPLAIDHITHGGLAFAVAGHGSSAVSCGIPRQPPGWKGCIDGAGKGLVVNIP